MSYPIKFAFPLVVTVLGFFATSDASARDYDLKPYLGGPLEEVIKYYTPSSYRQGVWTERLTIDHRGTVKGQVKIKYRKRVNTPIGRKTLWSATVRVYWTSYYANGQLSFFKVDIGHFKGVINTGSIKNALVNWLRRQAGYLRRFVQPPQQHNSRTPKRIYTRVNNQTGHAVHYTVIATGSGGKVEQNQLGGNRYRNHSWPGGMTIRFYNGQGQWRSVTMLNGRSYTFKRVGNAVELF